MRNALSIDLEDWFHAELLRSKLSGSAPQRRVEWAVEPFLHLLQRADVRATFFVVGDVLRHHPALVRRIYEQGHEIACHGWSHRPLWTLEPQRFAWELDEFDRAASQVLDVREVIGFRAPTFSLDGRTGWALDILRRHGYRYDSSIFPGRNYLYGVEDCPALPYRPSAAEVTLDHATEALIEFPMTAYRLGEFRLPISGGFYLRALPGALLRGLLAQVNKGGVPAVLYVHPWEADVHPPQVKGLTLLERFVTHYNAASVLHKLEALLAHFSFAPLREVLGLSGGRAAVAEERA
jgi:polysaccharide deacetylase family protein (PEP-CTERM system associated)